MLSLDDPRWTSMLGGYRVPYDPRRALAALEQSGEIAAALDELWANLHHQGDVGEVSYAAVPHLTRIHATKAIPEWHAYALAAVIEESRVVRRNPQLPLHLRDGYLAALRELAEIGLTELKTAHDPLVITSIISLVAFAKGQVSLGRLALLTEDERLEMLGQDEPI